MNWHTVMDSVAYWGRALIDDPERAAVTTAVGVDETKFLAAKRKESTRWVSAIYDVAARRVVDMIEAAKPPSSTPGSRPGPRRGRTR